MQPTKTENSDPNEQRRALLEAQRTANQDQPRNFKNDAIEEKVVHVEPDGTGPTSTKTFDPPADQKQGSGSDSVKPAGGS